MIGILALIVALLGFLLMGVGGIWFLIAAFRVSALWGIAVLFLPFANIFFLIKHWVDAKRPFQYQLLGLLVFMAGVAMTFNVGSRVASGKMAEFGNALRKQLMAIEGGGRTPDAGAVEGESASTYIMRYTGDVKELQMAGKTLQDARELLGPPKGILTTEQGVTFFYPGLELVAKDGRTITSQSFPAE